MKRVILFIIYIQISLLSYGQIIADHTVVDKYDDIPQYYIDEVKKMWLSYAGESHSEAIRDGLEALEGIDATYAVNVTESGTPEAYTTSHLRASRATWGDLDHVTGWIYNYGEEDWFTSETAIDRTKSGITYCNSNNLTIGAFGFGWCTDLGIDFNDYISSTQEYVDYCTDSIDTKVFFTTGTVNTYTGEIAFVKHQGYELIRAYVDNDNSLILFDYADILCYNDAGQIETDNWDGHTFPIIHPDNMEGTSTGHIGMVGAVRLAKAMWWMLARIAGWDGGAANIPVEEIIVSGAGGSSTINTAGGTLQLTATVSPSNATNKTVTWSIINGTGQATISSTGLVTAVSNGTVTARATANDGSGVYGQITITISGQLVPVTGITVSGAGGSSTITTDNGTLQLTASVSPSNATDKTVTWSIINGTGQATISSTGLVTAVSNGTVTARATANDGSGVYGQITITISGQLVPVTGITVSGAGGSSTITTDNGTLQLTASVSPSNATNKTVTWSISNGTGEATINSSGLVTAVANGTVTARATANDGSGIYGQLLITISNQGVRVTAITVTGEGGSSTISTDGGTLQLTATVSPTNATNKTVTWSISNGTGEATINSSGLVIAVADGTVTARATANDGSGVYGELVISISNQIVPVTDIIVSSAGGYSIISTLNGTLQLSVNISPTKATDKTVTWSISSVTGEATISSTGLVTAVSNGTVIARATANDGSGVYGELTITITNQFVAVSGITINIEGGQTLINIPGGTLQLQAIINPADASDQSVTWEVINGTGEAEISPTGLLTAISEGTVTVRATANDGTGISTTLEIIIEFFTYNYFRVIVNGGLIEVIFNEDHTGYNLSLYDYMGSLRCREIINGISCQFNASPLSPGPYYIILSSTVIHEVRKILLVK